MTPPGSLSATSSADRRRTVARLFDELAECPDGSPAARRVREQLVATNTPLVRHLTRRYAGGREPTEDLLQVAMMGLVKAINRYDRTRPVDFAAFAVPTILGELRRYFRDQTWGVHLPRSLTELHLKVAAARATLAQRLGREATLTEIAEETDASIDDVVLALYGGRSRYTGSLDALRDGDRYRPDADPPARDGSYEQVDDAVLLGSALRQLPTRSRHVLMLRFFDDKTQVEIAADMGVSQMQVSRLIARSIEQLRGLLRDTVGPGDEPLRAALAAAQ